MRVLNPAEVIVLMHCYAIAEPLDGYKGSIDSLLVKGLIENYTGRCPYRTTEQGSAMVEMICATPQPVQKWVDPRRKINENSNDA